MNPSTRNSLIGVGVVAAVATIALLIPSSNPPPAKKWTPKPNHLYPRLVQPNNVSNEDWIVYMESKAKTNIPGTKIWTKVSTK